jgi:uncharacterized repeat protein (TIGR01451 family)
MVRRRTNTTYTAMFVPISADVGVTQSGTSGGGRATFTITTRNGGPATAREITLTDTLTSKLTFVSASAGCTYTAATKRVTCVLGDLAANAEVTVTAVVGYKAKGNADHTVTVSTTTPDPVTSNNTSRISLRLR